ncbi:MAG: hypothetical protein ACREUS_00415 [Burkholderiales bacterium]
MRWLAFALLLSLAATAAAQLRTIPKEAKRGEIRHLQEMIVEIDGKSRHLAPGAQIRDPDNRLVLPVSLSGKADVKYLLDAGGMVHRVWILSPRERAALPPTPFPK